VECTGKAGAVDAGDCAFAEARADAARRREERSEEDGEVGIVADDKDVVVAGEAADEILKLLHGGVGSEGFRDFDFAFVTGFGADERSGLQGALERARYDAVKLDIEGVEEAADEEALLLAFFIEGALDIDEGVRAPCARAGMAKNIEIHGAKAGGVVLSSRFVT